MQIDRQKFQQNTVETNRANESLPQPPNRGQEAVETRKPEKKKLHPRAYESAERWDGMS